MDVDIVQEDSGSLFFAGSDDDEPTTPFNQHPDTDEHQEEKVPSKRLFIADSDDEDISELIALDDEIPRAPSVGHISNDGEAPLQRCDPAESSAKKRRLSPPCPQSSKGDLPLAPDPSKRGAYFGAVAATTSSSQNAAYLGSFIVGNAWATVKGKGYVTAG